MESSDLKKDLIKSISLSENVSLLKEIKRLLMLDFIDEEVYTFTPEQQKRIDASIGQYKNGECISDEEHQKEVKGIHQFTDEQKQRVLNSLEQYQNGNSMTSQEAEDDIKQWIE